MSPDWASACSTGQQSRRRTCLPSVKHRRVPSQGTGAGGVLLKEEEREGAAPPPPPRPPYGDVKVVTCAVLLELCSGRRERLGARC